MRARLGPAARFDVACDTELDIVASVPPVIATTRSCLEQLAAAFDDIAERDDIHQAAARLSLVQDWIMREAAAADADPIFTPVRLAS